MDIARCEEVANTIETRFPVHIQPVVGREIEGPECFAPLHGTVLQIFIKHLLPTRCVNARGVGDHAIEIEQDGVVLFAGDRTPGIWLWHFSLLLPVRFLSRDFTGRMTRQRPVPNLYGGDVAVIAENAQGAGIQQKMLPRTRRRPDPARNEHAQHVPVGE